jgi:hypothetical protein
MIAMMSPSITVSVMMATGALCRARNGLRDARGLGTSSCGLRYNDAMKLLLEILVALILHPVAFILAIVNLAGRDDLTPAQKIVWGVVSVVWGVGPILYVIVGGGSLW